IKQWDEIKEFIDGYLAREPHLGQNIPNTELYAVTILTNPQLTLYYTVKDDLGEITLVDLLQI
ncbi:MAG: hypothetical protein WCF70_02270, partial [Dehalococcoidales bacterium]